MVTFDETALSPLRRRGGNVAMMAALLLVPLLLVVGVGIDFGRLATARATLSSATDAAALSAARLAMDGDLPDAEIIGKAKDYVRTTFESNARGAVLTAVDAHFEGDEVVVDASAEMTTSFLGLAGITTLTTSEHSVSSFQPRAVLDFHILLDTSESMGLAADGPARAALRKATVSAPIPWRQNCEFACHLTEDATLEPVTRLQLARSLGIELRIDAAKAGIRHFMDLATSDSPGLVPRFSITAFNTDHYAVVPLTADTARVGTALTAVDVAYGRGMVPWTFGDTFFDQAVRPFGTQALNYSEAAIPKRSQPPYALIVSDGVQSGWGKTREEGTLRVFDQSDCTLLKSMGFKVLVLYTRYYPIPSDHFYQENVAPIQDQIEPNMRACASDPSMFAAADTPAEIKAAFKQIFDRVKAQIRIVR